MAIALSGGKDSTTLLHILSKLEAKFPQVSLFAITVDEGIRGYRKEALKIASKVCSELKIPHIIVSFKELYGATLDRIVGKAMSQGSKLEPCSYCGVLRRKALNIGAKRLGVMKLATAHNLDDEVQTLLINVFHGDIFRLARSGPISPNSFGRFPIRVKPLYEVPEPEVTLYAYTRRLRFQSKPCPYARFSLRTEVRSIVNRLEFAHPGMKFTILKTFEKIRPWSNLAVKDLELRECEGCGEPSIGRLCKACEMLLQLGIS
ncbi:MAG: TIGR00269 family protein [Candidatus Bathyarchaeia archaeon]